MNGDMKNKTYISLGGRGKNVGFVWLVLDEVGQPCVETRILGLSRANEILGAKVRVHSDHQQIQEPDPGGQGSSRHVKDKGMYLSASGTFSQPSGRFIPGMGHAGQIRANSPGFVVLIPSRILPRPARFISFKCRYCRTMRISSL